MKKGQIKVKVTDVLKRGFKPSEYISRVTTLSMAYGFELIAYMKNKDFEVTGYGGDKNYFQINIDYTDKKRKRSLVLEITGKNFDKYHFVSQWRKNECHLLFLEKVKSKYKFVESQKIEVSS